MIEIRLDLSRIASALERLADQTEAIYAYLLDPAAVRRRQIGPVTPSTPEDIGRIDDESLWQQEQDDERRALLGLTQQQSEFHRP